MKIKIMFAIKDVDGVKSAIQRLQNRDDFSEVIPMINELRAAALGEDSSRLPYKWEPRLISFNGLRVVELILSFDTSGEVSDVKKRIIKKYSAPKFSRELKNPLSSALINALDKIK